MNKHFWLMGILAFASPIKIARADLGFWSARLVGSWRHPTNGDLYQFRSNATYTFRAGAAKKRGSHISHSGFWKIVPPTDREAGGGMEGQVALRLKSPQRTRRLVVDIVTRGEGEVSREFYQIGGAKWRRTE